MSRSLWNHQVEGIKNALATEDYGLFFEMGTGKTRTTIEVLRRRYAQEGRLMKTLILAPPAVCPNWKDEFRLYSKIKGSSILVLQGPGKQRVSNFIKAVGDELKEAKIVITNYEAMQMDDLYTLLYLWCPEIVVSDESQRLKNPKSKRAKALVSITDRSKYNYILTGSPITQSPMDLFMQFRVLDRGKTFGKNFFSFRARYFMDSNAAWSGREHHFPKWVPNPTMYKELQEKVRRKSMRVLKSECLDLPPLVRLTRSVTLSPPQAKAYKEMYNEYITFIEDKKGEPRAVVAQLAVVKALRLQQIASGFANDDTGVAVRFPSIPRLDCLSELLQEICIEGGHKVIVWAAFQENYAMIAELCDKLGIQHTDLTGQTKNREANMREFRSNPDVKVMVSNQAAGGVGINLVEASYMIYYSKGFSLEQDMQSEARNYRGGSEMHSRVTRIDLVATGTMDEHVNEALHNKLKISEQILDWR